MISFESDYNNGAYPAVLRHLINTNDNQSKSYGFDEWSEAARKKIREACQMPDAAIYFLVGGTQTNATVIASLLSAHEGVVAIESGHISIHEAGAIEATGHKVLVLPEHDGKMHADDLRHYLQQFHADANNMHMVHPGMVYITFPTEFGTIYRANEIAELHSICRQYHIPLYIDGARLGYGLMSDDCDFDLPWLAHHCDVFYIGGTKVGTLCGEAVVFSKQYAPHHAIPTIKLHGALLAKSRLVGVQFDALFTDNLYFNISRHAIDMAMKLRQLFKEHGFSMKDSPTNQQFVLLNNDQIEPLRQHVAFEVWEAVGSNHSLCRFVTSWYTSEQHLQSLNQALKTLKTSQTNP